MNDGRGDIVLAGTWMCSGWQYVLPQQATALHMLVATATDRDLDGSLDALVKEFGYAWFDYLTDGLQCHVRWTHPLDVADVIEARRRTSATPGSERFWDDLGAKDAVKACCATPGSGRSTCVDGRCRGALLA